MRCRNCGKDLGFGEAYCGFCGAPAKARRGGGSVGFTLLICILVLLALLCAGACYLLLTRGPDPAAWFVSADAVATASPAPAAHANGAPLQGSSGLSGLPDLLPKDSPALEDPAGGILGLLATPTPAFAIPTVTPTAPVAAPLATPQPPASPAATVTPGPTATPGATATPAPTSTEDIAHRFLDALVVEGLGRTFTADELRDKTKYELSVLRNGMYALSGLEFRKNAELKAFFADCDWYEPNTTDAEKVYARFNEFQKANVAAIVAIEKEKGYR